MLSASRREFVELRLAVGIGDAPLRADGPILFQLPPAELAAIGFFLLATISLVAALFWKRAKSNRRSGESSSLPASTWTQAEPF